MTPRQHATAFRVWQYAHARGWDCTTAEIAEALGLGARSVAMLCHARGWLNRLRSTAVAGDIKAQRYAGTSYAGDLDTIADVRSIIGEIL